MSGQASRQQIVNHEAPTATYRHLEAVQLQLERRMQKTTMSRELALQLEPRAHGEVAVANVSAVLGTKNHSFRLSGLNECRDASPADFAERQRRLCGRPSAVHFLDAMRARGLEASSIQESGEGVELQYAVLNAVVFLAPGRSRIECADERTRRLLAETLLTQCSELTATRPLPCS